jgi:hypothetical protein
MSAQRRLERESFARSAKVSLIDAPSLLEHDPFARRATAAR